MKDKIKNTFKLSLSRTKIEDFIQCPRCFYLDVKLNIKKPQGPPFTLNAAVDYLLKKEFDIHRAKNKVHPLMEKYNIKAVPFNAEEINKWRNSGIAYYHPDTNIEVKGKLDDVWVNDKGYLMVIDYKATSTSSEITLDGGGYKDSYKREVEIYQWLLRKNGFKVDDVCYFVYVNALKDKEAFDGKLEFDLKILEYKGDDSWIEQTLFDIKKTIDQENFPQSSSNCEFCSYFIKRFNLENLN
jgi:CRISPR/Cas system-associated exonuclease Cas4 (RecB family)